MNRFSEAFWLAGRDVRRLARRDLSRTWPSYLTTGIVMLLGGLWGLWTLWEVLQSGNRSASLALDLLFAVVLVANFSANFTSRSYMHLRHEDAFSKHLSFLRTLPVAAGEIVAGRVAVMLASTAVMAVVFFAPFYLLYGGLREEIGAVSYLCFAAIWVGYALVCAGLILYLELAMPGGPAFWLFMVWGAVLLGAVLLCNLVIGAGLVTGSLGLAESYGPVPGLISLAAGGAGLLMMSRATARRIERRSL